jgi:hypothetical protein
MIPERTRLLVQRKGVRELVGARVLESTAVYYWGRHLQV